MQQAISTMTFDGVGWLQFPEVFASTLYLLDIGYWQRILVVVVTQPCFANVIYHYCEYKRLHELISNTYKT